MRKIRETLLHICAVCSFVSIIVKILDWFNPFMDFEGHVLGAEIILYVAVIFLTVTSRHRISCHQSNKKYIPVIKEKCASRTRS